MDTEKTVSQRKCPECGSTELWNLLSKPPQVVCRRCGFTFPWTTGEDKKTENPFQKQNSENRKATNPVEDTKVINPIIKSDSKKEHNEDLKIKSPFIKKMDDE